MNKPTRLFMIILLLILPSITFASAAPKLEGPPLGERWFSISMNGEWVGFSHTRVSKTSDGFELFSEGSARLKVMGTSRQASSRERYQVGPDLSLRTFEVDQIIEGKPVKINGGVIGKVVKITSVSAGKTKTSSLKFKKQLLPPPALNFYAPMHGAAPGRKFDVQMLDVEGLKIKGVEIEVVGVETLPKGEQSLHIRNDLYPIVDNDIWLDLAGNTLKESVRDDLIVTRAEDAQTVLTFVAEAALAQKDLIADFSRIPTAPPLKDPAALKALGVSFIGFPSEYPLLQGAGQSATRVNGATKFLMSRVTPKNTDTSSDQGALAPYLEPVPGANGKIAAKAGEISGNEQDRAKAAEKLSTWVAAKIKRSTTEAGSMLETLEKGKAVPGPMPGSMSPWPGRWGSPAGWLMAWLMRRIEASPSTAGPKATWANGSPLTRLSISFRRISPI